jgi:ribose transport system permease protein
MEDMGVPVWLSIILGVLLGAAAGAVEGSLIVKTGINPFVITLSLASIYLGGVTAVTQAKFYSHMPQAFNDIGIISLWGVPLLFIIALVVGAILWVIMARTPLGRQLLATGANVTAASFSGIPTRRVILVAHTMSGGLGAVAGILLASRLGSAQISIGNDWLLVSFAAPVLGGTILSGGKVSVIGTIVGAALMSLITNALVLVDVSYFWFQSFLGVILLGAFVIDRARLAYITQSRS